MVLTHFLSHISQNQNGRKVLCAVRKTISTRRQIGKNTAHLRFVNIWNCPVRSLHAVAFNSNASISIRKCCKLVRKPNKDFTATDRVDFLFLSLESRTTKNASYCLFTHVQTGSVSTKRSVDLIANHARLVRFGARLVATKWPTPPA